MEDSNVRRVLRRHIAITRRIRALDPRQESAEFAEGRLRDYAERVKELIRLRMESPTDSVLNGGISVSLKLLNLKREQFKLPVTFSFEDSLDDLDDGGMGVPSPVKSDPPALSGSGAREVAESDEINDW